MKTVGNNIRKERINKGLSLAALGEDIGLDKGNLYRIEQGKNFTLLTLTKIGAFLEVNPARLFNNCNEIRIQDAENYIKKNKQNRKT